MIFPGTEVRLTGWSFTGSSFIPFLKIVPDSYETDESITRMVKFKQTNLKWYN